MHECRNPELRRAGEAFASIRKNRGYSQADLARAVRLHANTISNIERGAFEPSILALGLLCLELGCSRIQFDGSGFLPLAGPSDSVGMLSRGFAASEISMASLHGSCIRSRRLAAGLSIDELARAAAIHPNTLRNFELGLTAPSALGASRVYTILGIPYVDGSGGPRA